MLLNVGKLSIVPIVEIIHLVFNKKYGIQDTVKTSKAEEKKLYSKGTIIQPKEAVGHDGRGLANRPPQTNSRAI